MTDNNNSSCMPLNLKLLTPVDYNTNNGSKVSHCRFVLDESERLIKVVSLDDSNDVLDVIDLDDVIGANISIENTTSVTAVSVSDENNNTDRAANEPSTDTPQDMRGTATLCIYSYPRVDSSKLSYANRLGVTTYQPKPDPSYTRGSTLLGHRTAHVRTFVLAPSEDLHEASQAVMAIRKVLGLGANKKYLVVVNPMSGSKMGTHICTTLVQPLLEQAGIDYEVCITTQAHQELGLDNGYDAIVLVGGDGTLHECLQQIMKRTDATNFLEQVPIGMVGCGSANGFAASLLHGAGEKYGALECVFQICKGHTIKADISKYQTTNNEYTSFLTFAWAMVADLDFESEIIRFVGEARFHLWAVLRILALRRYPAKFSYLPPPSSNDKSNKPLDNNMPALTSPVPANWVTIEDNFIVFWVSQVPKASVNDLQSPKSTLDDGVFRAFIIRGNVSRFQLIKCLLHLDTGGHIDQDCVEYIECVAYRLEPTAPGSYNDIDGEKVEDGPIQAHVIRGCMRVFAGKPVAL